MKRGLVLEGGGAKGAYQFGCLLAFRDHGIRFDVIAGTSIGAVNGALLSSGNLDRGEKYWKSLTFRRAFAPRWRWLPLSPLLALYGSSYLAGRGGLPLTARNLRITVGLFIAGWIVSALYIGIATAWPSLLFAAAMLVLWTGYYGLRAVRFSVLVPSPLTSFVEDTISTSEALQTPLFATLADREIGFDPDDPNLFAGKDLGDHILWAAIEEEYEYPNYILVNDLSLNDQRKVIIGSAALPLGIFPPVIMNANQYTDGGTADNLPLYPVVSLDPCSEVVVIALRPTRTESFPQQWQRVDRLLRRRALSITEARELYFDELARRKGDRNQAEKFDPPVNLPLREPSWPDVVLIAPRKKLGNFLTGTMNFRARYTSRLLDDGYRDAVSAIENGLIQPAD